MEINVYSENTKKYIGTIYRKATHSRESELHGAFEVSVGGKRYWGHSWKTERILYLPDVAIKYLNKHKEIKKSNFRNVLEFEQIFM